MLIKVMEGVEDIPGIVMAEGIPWNWETFPEYLDALEKRPCDIDFATQIPHGPVRVYVMGERGANREAATPEDLTKMREIAREAFDQFGRIEAASSIFAQNDVDVLIARRVFRPGTTTRVTPPAPDHQSR